MEKPEIRSVEIGSRIMIEGLIRKNGNTSYSVTFYLLSPLFAGRYTIRSYQNIETYRKAVNTYNKEIKRLCDALESLNLKGDKNDTISIPEKAD